MSLPGESSESLDLVPFLLRARSYPEATRAVSLKETHISWVFLTDRHAYKLKKPVRFEFLDFSTAAARRRACEDEVRLNRRLASDVYLGVVPVTRDERRRLAIGGRGEPVDWLVKMRRLCDERTLESLIRQQRLADADVDRLGRMLAEFYTLAAPLTVLPEEHRRQIERHVRANAADLATTSSAEEALAVRRIHAAQLRFLRLHAGAFDGRACDGRIIEGHGDLRPEHIYVKGGRPAVIDCVEFSAELRRLDVADDLSFLAMECTRLGAEEIGRRVINAYRRQSGDPLPEALLAFYKSYRACVRAKVAALRAAQVPDGERVALAALERRYLELADVEARRLGPPPLVVVRGLMGTGKSTLAAALADALAADLLSTDRLRTELGEASDAPADYGTGSYTAAKRREVYEVMFERARGCLSQGLAVVLDGTFLSNELRRRAVGLAKVAGAVPLVVTCHCPAEVARERMTWRIRNANSPSEARPELLAAQQAEDEPPADDLPLLEIDTTQSLNGQIDGIVAWLAVETER